MFYFLRGAISVSLPLAGVLFCEHRGLRGFFSAFLPSFSLLSEGVDGVAQMGLRDRRRERGYAMFILMYIIRVYSLLPNLASAFSSCSGCWVGGLEV